MRIYIKELKNINKFSEKDFCRFSLSAKDYRVLSTENKNTFPLIDFVVKKKRGKEIGSDNYFKKSKYRFLKTVNISNPFCFDEASIEFCNPQKNHNPQKDDILIAKDGGGDGLGEIALYNKENKNNQDSISAGIIAIQIKKEYLYYILGILKSNHFKNFIDLNTAQGSTIRHSKEIALKYQIPFPASKNNKSPKDIEKLVSLIVQNIIDKEEQIKAKNGRIDFLIEEELRKNQKKNNFKYQLPRISEIKGESRLDTGLYGIKNKEFVSKLRSYAFGLRTIKELGFKSKRGHNLAISVAGTSYYSDTEKKNFYLLVTSTDIDDTRTLNKKRYLGNLNKLVSINKGDIMFSATGQVETSVGKTYVFCDLNRKTTSNFNSFFFYKKDYLLYENIFVAMFLSWLKHKGFYINLVGKGNGGSFTEYHFNKLLIPNFPESKQKEIAREYYCLQNKNNSLNLNNYIKKEKTRNSKSGIFQLNMEIFALRDILEDLVDKIINEEQIEVNFEY